VITSIYLVRVEKTFLPVANQLPFDMATSLDLELDKLGGGEGELAGAEDYTQPSMRAPKIEMPAEEPTDDEVDCSL